MKTQRRSLESVELLEDIPQTRGRLSVDRKAGIIRNVKFIGFVSPNGRKGARQTRYKPEAVQRALHLYEGKHVYMDHPEGRNAYLERKVKDLAGELYGCRLESDGGYANIRCLKGDPNGEKLLTIAEQMPHLIGLSHNADGRGYVDGATDEFLIESIPIVRSVDVVTRPATTTSLLESQERTMKKKKSIQKVLESRGWKKTPEIVALLEDDALGMDASAPMPEPAAPAEDESLHWKEHLKNAIGAILDDDTLSEDQVLKNIKEMLGTMNNAEKVEKPAPEGEGGEEEETEEEDTPVKESLDLETRVKRFEAKDDCVALCESLDFAPSRDQVELLADLPTEAKRTTMIEAFKGSSSKPPRVAPGTGGSPKNRSTTTTLESKNGKAGDATKTVGSFVNSITGGRVTVAAK